MSPLLMLLQQCASALPEGTTHLWGEKEIQHPHALTGLPSLLQHSAPGLENLFQAEASHLSHLSALGKAALEQSPNTP